MLLHTAAVLHLDFLEPQISMLTMISYCSSSKDCNLCKKCASVKTSGTHHFCTWKNTQQRQLKSTAAQKTKRDQRFSHSATKTGRVWGAAKQQVLATHPRDWKKVKRLSFTMFRTSSFKIICCKRLQSFSVYFPLLSPHLLISDMSILEEEGDMVVFWHEYRLFRLCHLQQIKWVSINTLRMRKSTEYSGNIFVCW